MSFKISAGCEFAIFCGSSADSFDGYHVVILIVLFSLGESAEGKNKRID